MKMIVSNLPELHSTNQEMLGQIVYLAMFHNGFRVDGVKIEFEGGEA